MRNLLVILLSLVSLSLNATNYWITPRGSDSNAGTDSSSTGAWASWYKFSSVSNPGDTVFIKEGVYYATAENNPGSPSYSKGIYLYQKNGTAANPIVFMAYPGDTVIWDLSNVTSGYQFSPSNFYGLNLYQSNWLYFKGLEFRNFWGDGQSTSVTYVVITDHSNHITFENCKSHHSRNYGFKVAYSVDVKYLNCDAWEHCDSLRAIELLPGNAGYGFNGEDTGVDGHPSNDSIVVKGCRAWECSDDGFVMATCGLTIVDSCWSFNNGRMLGEGHGFKMGWVELKGADFILNQIYRYNLALYNRASGFVTNEDNSTIYVAAAHVYNNTSYHNGYYPTRMAGSSARGFLIFDDFGSPEEFHHEWEESRIFRNNIAYDNEDSEINVNWDTQHNEWTHYTHSNNSWDSDVTLSDGDFIDLDSATAIAILKGPRQADGSLPDLGNFLKLGSGSDLIDMGEDTIDDGAINELRVIPETDFNGSAPDLGAFEYTPTDPPVLPIIITTTNPFYLTETTARSGGYIVDDGGSAIFKKGVCWNTTGTPTVRAADDDSSTNDGNGSGSFSSTMWGLVIGTTYYVRAYAINSVDTAYGDQDAFTFIGQMKYVYVGGSLMMIQTKRAVVTTGEAESEGEPVPEYGDEMINEGDFTTSTKWGAHTGWTIADGVASKGTDNSGNMIYQTDVNMVSSIEASTTYRLTFDIVVDPAKVARLEIVSANEVIIYKAIDSYSNGTNIIEFTTASDIGVKGIGFMYFWASNAASFTIDNISLKKKL
jgi:hypothetical protein